MIFGHTEFLTEVNSLSTPFVEIVAWLFEWALIDFDNWLLYNNFKFVHKHDVKK